MFLRLSNMSKTSKSFEVIAVSNGLRQGF